MAIRNQTVGNIGLFYVCYRLSRLGWNVMPTSRNARGIDVLAYSSDGSTTITLQVKSLSKRYPVPLGNKLDHLIADFVIICRHVMREQPECFVLTPDEVKSLAHRGVKDDKITYWLQPQQYEAATFFERWDRIGSGVETTLATGEASQAVTSTPSDPATLGSKVFRFALQCLLLEAENKGSPFVEVNAGDLHRTVGGYPGPSHRMVTCCDEMKTSMRSGDTIVTQPPKGRGASLTIRYVLSPRQDDQ